SSMSKTTIFSRGCIVHATIKLAAAAAALFLAGCNRTQTDAIEICEGYVLKGLRSPATYNRIEANAYLPTPGEKQVISVFITYDAENPFGTPLRSIEHCEFAMHGKTAPTRQEMSLAAARPY